MLKRVLIVEDNEVANHCYQLLLEDYPNLKGIFMDRGDAALAFVSHGKHPLDLVILDKGLPDIDGLLLAKQLRQKGVRCPMIMVSANRIPPLVQGQYLCFIQRFYVKPLTPDQFRHIVERYVKKPVKRF